MPQMIMTGISSKSRITPKERKVQLLARDSGGSPIGTPPNCSGFCFMLLIRNGIQCKQLRKKRIVYSYQNYCESGEIMRLQTIVAMVKEINQASDKWVIVLNKIIFMPQKLITSFISFDVWRAKTRIILIFLLLFSPFSITVNLHLYKVDAIFYNKRIMRVNDANLLFIRHGESACNLESERYVAKKKMKYDWEHLSKDHEYLTEIKYSYGMLDCCITEKGMGQCRQARETLQHFQPDVILVSPLNRALKTCSEIFPEPSCPVIVQPILAEGLRASADFSGLIGDKKINYPHYNFEHVEKAGEFWFIQNESKENQAKYKSIISAHNHQGYEQTLKAMFAYMLETFIFETPTNLRQRTDKLKLLLKNYSQKYLRIAVVSHYNIIRFILAKKFNKHDEPEHCHIENCEILTAAVEQL